MGGLIPTHIPVQREMGCPVGGLCPGGRRAERARERIAQKVLGDTSSCSPGAGTQACRGAWGLQCIWGFLGGEGKTVWRTAASIRHGEKILGFCLEETEAQSVQEPRREGVVLGSSGGHSDSREHALNHQATLPFWP